MERTLRVALSRTVTGPESEENVRDMPFLRDRRPETYTRLVQP